MSAKQMITIDGNEAAASVAHRVSEVIAIYPITPSSTMGELSDEWSAAGRKNIWGHIPEVTEMQSEGGAAGAVHGALQAGAQTTTFTASQGLLLMIPNMYKIAGELLPMCMHVSARTLATHALSIFGDHSDVMACRQTGFAMLASGSVQEAHDMALVAHAATLRTRVPFLHYFDGFRTSHEVAKIELLSDDDLRALIPDELVAAQRARALSPDHPVLRGAAQNPDTFFQAREAANSFYDACAGKVQEVMDELAKRIGRSYHLFDYVGHPEAEKVMVIMGSGAEVAHEAIDWMNANGEKVGLLKVRLYRPFALDAFLKALPKTTKRLCVLDRTKEPGALGDPLYMDVVTALREATDAGTSPFAKEPKVVGGRYGLSSKEFTPAMVKAAFDDLGKDVPRRHYVVGIVDDVTHTSLPYDTRLDIEPDSVVRCLFYGLGADGTVGANKNSVKIISEETGNFAQGYFVYDSKKSGAITISHLRFGPKPIRSAYLIKNASFVAVHHQVFLDKYDVLESAAPGATLLLNSKYPADQVWDTLPREVQEAVVEKKVKLFTIDAHAVAHSTGMGDRINTIMQTCFFAISGVLPREEALSHIRKSVKKTYAKKGEEVVRKNIEAVDTTLKFLTEVKVPGKASAVRRMPPIVADHAPDFVKKVTAVMLANKGDLLPVSAFPPDGTWPTGTARWEKRNIALEIPVFEASLCIQCDKCALVCPHAAIRTKVYPAAQLASAPATFKSMDYKGREFAGQKYSVQVAPEDCTGCNLCMEVCPGHDKANPARRALSMAAPANLLVEEKKNYDFFLNLPEADRTLVRLDVKGSQLLEPLFEYSGACSGCGETPYVKLITQLFGDRLLIANATGCSSIYGGNLPTTPYTKNRDGRGPAWANSLFEDNAEYGLGYRLAVDMNTSMAKALLVGMGGPVGDGLVKELLDEKAGDEKGIAAQRKRVEALKAKLAGVKSPEARRLETLADYLVPKSVWIVGGDGWAYDIGYGGLDHVLASGRNVKVLVLDTEVYSNTGGQASKATPRGASAKFAVAGKEIGKKDLGLIAMTYGSIYVARVAFGAKDAQTLRALTEAESFPGPALIIAFSHCIAHGYEMEHALDQQALAVATGYWPLFRYDPRKLATGENPLKLDSSPPEGALQDFMKGENRFRIVEKSDPERYKGLLATAQADAKMKYSYYE
ncbi:MAG: pyruvate:ferredoxin (flavodoxin) oxidoreductase [Myxococcaceae bacterium]